MRSSTHMMSLDAKFPTLPRRDARNDVDGPLRPYHNPRSSVARHNNRGSQHKASLQEESSFKPKNEMLNAIKTNQYCLPPSPSPLNQPKAI